MHSHASGVQIPVALALKSPGCRMFREVIAYELKARIGAPSDLESSEFQDLPDKGSTMVPRRTLPVILMRTHRLWVKGEHRSE